MSSAVATPDLPGRSFVALWRRHDTVRAEQLARLQDLELQAGDDYGQQAWEQAHLAWQNLPDGVRIDLPSPRVFGRVLGVFRTCATLKKNKISRLELSAEELAQLVGYAKSTVEAVLRWLGCNPIEYDGAQVARGLGVLHRGRRTGPAIIEGVRRMVYRTTRTVLTMLGRALLGLGALERDKSSDVKPERDVPAPAVQAEPSPPDPEPDDDPKVGRSWLERIQHSLK